MAIGFYDSHFDYDRPLGGHSAAATNPKPPMATITYSTDASKEDGAIAFNA